MADVKYISQQKEYLAKKTKNVSYNKKKGTHKKGKKNQYKFAILKQELLAKLFGIYIKHP